MVKFDTKIINNEKPRKVVRMKIKNMKLAPTNLFQVPFKTEQIDINQYQPIDIMIVYFKC